MIKFTIVRQVVVEEIHEVVASTPLEAIAIAKQGNNLQESFKVDEGSFRVENAEPGFDR